MTPNELINSLVEKFSGKMDNKLTLLEISNFFEANNDDNSYITLRLDSNYIHKDASYKALKLFCETIAITDSNLYDILNKKYDLRCTPLTGDALMSYVFAKMRHDDMIFDSMYAIFTTIRSDLNKEVTRLGFSKNKKTRKPLVDTFLKIKK